MDIQITPDAALPDDRVHVSCDLNDDLLTALESSRFEIIVDVEASAQSIRMSAKLADRIGQWQTLRELLDPDDTHLA